MKSIIRMVMLSAAVSVCLMGCGGGGFGSLTDSRDAKTYKTVKIGNQVWMAENLNYKTGKSWCYDGDNSNCEKYGRLYDWNTANTACPSGWHLPSHEEWNGLVAVSGGAVAGKTLKSTSGWDGNGNGVDGNGFSAMPGGGLYDGYFHDYGEEGVWWAATAESGSKFAYSLDMISTKDRVSAGKRFKHYGLSVRCLQDN
jgi:uncharacterized protein (TIGR02145 family)